MRLVNPPADVVDRLATEPNVVTMDVVTVLSNIDGLTEDEAMIYIDNVKNLRGWNLDTYMACIEGLAEARRSTN